MALRENMEQTSVYHEKKGKLHVNTVDVVKFLAKNKEFALSSEELAERSKAKAKAEKEKADAEKAKAKAEKEKADALKKEVKK